MRRSPNRRGGVILPFNKVGRLTGFGWRCARRLVLSAGTVGAEAMTLTVGFFYLFAVLAVASAAMVIIAKNPVHAVLFLILTFFNAAGLFILLGDRKSTV